MKAKIKLEPLRLHKEIECPHCDGTGRDYTAPRNKCMRCHGFKTVIQVTDI